MPWCSAPFARGCRDEFEDGSFRCVAPYPDSTVALLEGYALASEIASSRGNVAYGEARCRDHRERGRLDAVARRELLRVNDLERAAGEREIPAPDDSGQPLASLRGRGNAQHGARKPRDAVRLAQQLGLPEHLGGHLLDQK